MIILRAYRVMKSPSGKKRLLYAGILRKWSNEHIFDFNILKRSHWLKYLIGLVEEFRTAEGDDVAYEVYFWGVPKEIKECYANLPLKENNGYFCLFPGYSDRDGKKMDIATFGVLQNHKLVQKYLAKKGIKL